MKKACTGTHIWKVDAREAGGVALSLDSNHVTMPTLLLLCGLPGSGKTTLAKKLERERHALRLSPDEWLWSLSIDLYDEAKRTAVEILQWDIAARALALGA